MAKHDADEAAVELRMALLRHLYGDLPLTDSQWVGIREGVAESLVEVSAALASVPLDWADDPLPLFAPYRAADA